MEKQTLGTAIWHKSADFSLASESADKAEEIAVVVMSLPADARPSGIVHVGGSAAAAAGVC